MRASFPTFVAALLLCSCSSPVAFTVFVTPQAQPAVQSFFEFLPEAHAKIVASANPAKALSGSGAGTHVALVADLTCGECYRLASVSGGYEIHAGGTLGLQYGLAELLEAYQFRFFHPWGVKAPTSLGAPDKAALGPTLTPEMSLRGLHLHTIHPIESHYAFLVPGDAQLKDARRIEDWIIKNRGNYIQWSALDNIVPPGAVQDDWRKHTKAIIDEGHLRGLKVGLGFELFGNANLQQSYVVLDNASEANQAAAISDRLHLVLDGLPFDKLNISFGEFTPTDPTLFIQTLNLVYATIQQIAPGTELAATVHMGNAAGLQVTYNGQTLPYYFLVQFTDPHIVPWIHSVMYFDLFQNTAGAYGYDDFSQHRGYLQDQLKASKPVAYFPEAAYWVAFDDSVPTYLPVYMRSRWYDMSQLKAQAKEGGYATLDQHVLFSSGWEWGYWQNDYATLRMNFGLPSSWQDEVTKMFEPWGATGKKVAAQIGALGELQSKSLIDQGLAGYLAGRDYVIDFGATEGTVSQPPRPSFADVKAMDANALAQFNQNVLTPLSSLQSQSEQIQTSVAGLHLDANDPWLGEVIDGVEVDVARTQFINALYQAVAAFTATGADGGWLAKADAALAAGQAAIKRRHSRLHYPNPTRLTEQTTNATIYQYGYLYEADTLCYWQRERVQARAIVLGDTTAAPSCVL